jgi:glyoxylase-like metal-dependent hydrolase (beta-lactamase superfamily II)
VGDRDLVVIDPGPALDDHVTALLSAVRAARSVRIVVTHGHPDHSPAASVLAARLGESAAVSVLGPPGLAGTQPLAEGAVLSTDEGDLVAIDTPGHARGHFALHWPARRALFAGDLLLGKGDTVWVGEYAWCVADYLASLERVRNLALDVIYPAHGDPLTSPVEAIDRFAAHRRERVRQVEVVLAESPHASAEELLDRVYGPSLPAAARRPALRTMEVLKAHVEGRRS